MILNKIPREGDKPPREPVLKPGSGLLTLEQIGSITVQIINSIFESDKSKLYLASEKLRKKRGSPEDKPLNLLVYALVNDSILYTGKPRFSAVSLLLEERKGIHINYDDLRKRFKRLTPHSIMETLLYYGRADKNVGQALQQAAKDMPDGILKRMLSLIYFSQEDTLTRNALVESFPELLRLRIRN